MPRPERKSAGSPALSAANYCFHLAIPGELCPQSSVQHSTGRALAAIRAPPTPRPFPLISPTRILAHPPPPPNHPVAESLIPRPSIQPSSSPVSQSLSLPHPFAILASAVNSPHSLSGYSLARSQSAVHPLVCPRPPQTSPSASQSASSIGVYPRRDPRFFPPHEVSKLRSPSLSLPVEPSPALNVTSLCSPFSSSKLLARSRPHSSCLPLVARSAHPNTPLPPAVTRTTHSPPGPGEAREIPPWAGPLLARLVCRAANCSLLPPAAALHQKLLLHPPSPFLFTPHHLVFALSRLTSSSLHSSLHPSVSLAFIHGSHSPLLLGTDTRSSAYRPICDNHVPPLDVSPPIHPSFIKIHRSNVEATATQPSQWVAV